MMDIWLFVRIFCVIGCVACGLLLSTAKYRQWKTWSVKTQYHWWALGGWVFVGIYGITENIIQGNPGGSRLIVLALVIALTLRALLYDGELRAKSSLSRKDAHE